MRFNPYKKSSSFSSLLIIFFIVSLLAGVNQCFAAQSSFDLMFGSYAQQHDDLNDLPNWLTILTRHPREDKALNSDLISWLAFLKSLKKLPQLEQIKKVNTFANQKKYVLDSTNYGVADYWAIVREFLHFDGDCEDFAITKFFSLRQLGIPKESLRVVILHDSNLDIAHAVLAVLLNNDILIMDNQVNQVLSHKDILHYTPLYSVNEDNWWLHLPTQIN